MFFDCQDELDYEGDVTENSLTENKPLKTDTTIDIKKTDINQASPRSDEQYLEIDLKDDDNLLSALDDEPEKEAKSQQESSELQTKRKENIGNEKPSENPAGYDCTISGKKSKTSNKKFSRSFKQFKKKKSFNSRRVPLLNPRSQFGSTYTSSTAELTEIFPNSESPSSQNNGPRQRIQNFQTFKQRHYPQMFRNSLTSQWKSLANSNFMKQNNFTSGWVQACSAVYTPVVGPSGNSSRRSSDFSNETVERKNALGAMQADYVSVLESSRFSNQDVGTNFRLKSLSKRFNADGKRSLQTMMRANLSQEIEKELIKIKKEARLNRFTNDRIIREQPNNSVCSQVIKGEKRNEVLSCKQTLRLINESPQFEALHRKIEINQDLLKKKNPFGRDFSVAVTTNTEPERGHEVKRKIFEKETLKSFGLSEEPPRSIFNASQRENVDSKFLFVKSEDRNVTIVRTISKSYDELGLTGTKNRQLADNSGPKKNSTQLTTNVANEEKINEEKEKAQNQEQFCLIGRIVKVFNIPQSTTIDDILKLCHPISKPLEVKLNLPKEKSAVIVFSKPCYAENFQHLYQGQKLLDYFLNVIVF